MRENPPRHLGIWACCGLLLAAAAPLLGNEPTATATQAPVPTTGSPWDLTATGRASAGWRTNVTLSSFHSLDRAFWRTEAELIVLRRFAEQWRLIGYADADLLRYVSPAPGVPGEQELVASIELRWQPAQWTRTSVKGVGFTQTTFIDPSETEGSQQLPLRVRLRAGFSTFAERFSLPAGFAVEPSFQVKEVRYVGYAGDYTETRPGIRVLWTRSPVLELSAAFFASRRSYAELAPSTAANRPLPGQKLSLRQQEAELRARTRRGNWTVTLVAARLGNRDRTQGFLDYDQNRASLDVEWERGPWRVTLQTDARRMDYLVQKVGVGTSRPARIADAYDLTGHVERDVGHNWAIFLENRWERRRSNVADDSGAHPFSYRTNLASAGIQRTF